MIKVFSKFFRNELNRDRWRRFSKTRRSFWSLVLIVMATFFSFTAEIWSNSKPLVMKVGGSYYFPIAKNYHPTVFGQNDSMVTDYRALPMNEGDWAIWPINRWDPFESNKEVVTYPSNPSKDNWIGTDDRGRDLFSRLLYGFRYSLVYSVLVWALSVVVAIILGGIMGYSGGWIDLVGQRLVEIWTTVPVMFLLIILVAIFNPTLTLLVVLSSIFGWMGMSYYVRAEFLKNRKMEFVEAARALGAGQRRILFKHILPNSLTPIITFSPFIIAGHVYGLAALDYLGFGVPPPTPSWGELLGQAQKHFTTAWWLAIFPSLALFLSLVLLSMIGDGVRVAFEPREK